jgi:hypothetical protein
LTEGLFSSSPDKAGSLDSMMKGMREMLEQGTASQKPRDPTQPGPPPRTTPGAEARRDAAPPGASKEETPGAKEMQDSIQGILKDLLKDR